MWLSPAHKTTMKVEKVFSEAMEEDKWVEDMWVELMGSTASGHAGGDDGQHSFGRSV